MGFRFWGSILPDRKWTHHEWMRELDALLIESRTSFCMKPNKGRMLFRLLQAKSRQRP